MATKRKSPTPRDVRQARQAAEETLTRDLDFEDKVRDLLKVTAESADAPTADVIDAAWSAMRRDKSLDLTDRQTLTAVARAWATALGKVADVDSARAALRAAESADKVKRDLVLRLVALKGVTQKEAADAVSLSEARVSQIVRAADLVNKARKADLSLSAAQAESVVTGRASGGVTEVKAAIAAGDADALKSATARKGSGARVSTETSTADAIAAHVKALTALATQSPRPTTYAEYVKVVGRLEAVTARLVKRAAEVAESLPTSERQGTANAA